MTITTVLLRVAHEDAQLPALTLVASRLSACAVEELGAEVADAEVLTQQCVAGVGDYGLAIDGGTPTEQLRWQDRADREMDTLKVEGQLLADVGQLARLDTSVRQ